MQEKTTTPARTRRIEAVDLARGAALIAMAVYHFAWDLEFFGYAEPGMTAVGGWKFFARSIASTFLFLVGVSLYLAHSNGIGWAGVRLRFAMVAGAALAISIATYFFVPDAFIFFGILHQIAFASLAGLLFLRLPAIVVVLIAGLVIAAPIFLRSEIFDYPLLWPLGLSSADPRSNDYVPVFPWFGAVLLGLAAAKIAASAGILDRLAHFSPPRPTAPLLFAGKHSLAFYLIHQPVLIGCVYLLSLVAPAPVETREARFVRACEMQCGETRDASFCEAYCACMIGGIQSAGRIDEVFSTSETVPDWLNDLAGECTFQTDTGGGLEGEEQ